MEQGGCIMTTLRDFLGTGDDVVEHPTVRLWRSWIEAAKGCEARVELHRPRDVIGFKPAKLYFYVLNAQSKPIHSGQDDWDPDLNRALVRLGVRAMTPENEGQRFSLSLAEALSKPENRYGDGFFNSVLVEVVKEIDFSDFPRMAEILKHVVALEPNRMSPSYSDCREMIVQAIGNQGRELREHLGYAEDEATRILSNALANYLDERFSVTNRRVMGLS
jgi:hypothetical protein